MPTKLVWIGRTGRKLVHTLGAQVSRFYAVDLFRRSIMECQGILSRDEARTSQFKLLAVIDALDEDGRVATFVCGKSDAFGSLVKVPQGVALAL